MLEMKIGRFCGLVLKKEKVSNTRVFGLNSWKNLCIIVVLRVIVVLRIIVVFALFLVFC